MDRAAGIRSGKGANGSYQDMSFAISPSSSYVRSPASDGGPDLPQASSDFRQSSFLSPASPSSSTWPTTASLTQEISDTLPLSNIEKDGDPRIAWQVYYDFKVDQNEAYYELKPGFLVTLNYPRRKRIDNSDSDSGKKRYICKVPLCKAKPFGRHCDLERHFSSMHTVTEFYYCDYKKCPHEDPISEKDHAREHYREYHMEDLVKRSDSRVQHFLAMTVDRWWRSSRMHQVQEVM